MKASIFLTSFLSMNCSGSKPLTSPAMRAEKRVVSNRVIDPIPLCPASSAVQLASVPTPTDEIRPTPVTTTRLVNVGPRGCAPAGTPTRSLAGSPQAPLRSRDSLAHCSLVWLPKALRACALLLFRVGLDVLDGFLHAGDLLGVFVRDLDAKLFLERHDQLDRVQRVGAQVVDK